MAAKRDFVCQANCCESFAGSEWKNMIKALMLNISQYFLKPVELRHQRMWGVDACDALLQFYYNF